MGKSLAALAGVGAVALACGSRSGIEGCAAGSLGCPCQPERTCQVGLLCDAMICAPQSTDGAAGSTAAGGAQGATQPSFGGQSGRAGSAQTAGASSGGASPTRAPAVLVLLDGSLSMFDRQVWDPTHEALLGPDGPIQEYQGRVRFGFASYRGTTRTTEEDPACADITAIGFAPSNHAAVRDAYQNVPRPTRRERWETPTGHALTRVMELFVTEPSNTSRSILLISDGAPDTCATTNPQCGQDRAVFAVQSAARVGIRTYAVGIGFGNIYPGCSPETARCGSDHFQDLANAGVGLPVVEPPVGYADLACTAVETGGKLLATYSPQGGMAPLHWTLSPQDVAAAVRSVLADIVASSP